ncbi:MAG TPA: IS200/IS605 family transposase [Bacteroidia bacterium]|nr:IS200/IS605 family transposase [Bacteroidia bacterium]
MADSYSKIQIHVVFAVKYRNALIHADWEEELYKYITGIVTAKGHKLLAINGMPDHIHIFIGLRPVEALSALVREIKKASTNFINQRGFIQHKFQWQEGYGSFSYAESQVKTVVNYILNQKEHHAVKKFNREFIEMLQEFGVEYTVEHLFKDAA